VNLRNAQWIVVVGLLVCGANKTMSVAPQPRGLEEAQNAFPDATGKDLVFVGTVTEIYPVSAAHSLREWAVVAHVDKVVSGEFSGTTFTFAIHSPARSGLLVGHTYTINATRTVAGYVVDEASAIVENASSKTKRRKAR
jgi:hypothetical protein